MTISSSTGPGQVTKATYSMEEVATLFDIGRNAAYEAARRGDFPTVKIGKSVRAPKALIDQMLGIRAATP
jgi:predicted DNA-binding transcriptional regulator AlpA